MRFPSAWWHLNAVCSVLLMRNGILWKGFHHSGSPTLKLNCMQSILVLLSRITLLFYTLPLVPFVGLHGTAFVALFMGLYGSNSVCLPRTRQHFTSTVLAVTSWQRRVSPAKAFQLSKCIGEKWLLLCDYPAVYMMCRLPHPMVHTKHWHSSHTSNL